MPKDFLCKSNLLTVEYMTSSNKKDGVQEAFVQLDEDKVLSTVNESLENDVDPNEILKECRKAVAIVGEKFEKGEYFLNDLVVAGEIFKEINNRLKPEIEKQGGTEEVIGDVLIGTVQGDMHNIGKNIQIAILEANGFEVYDLGVDVPPEKFVEEVEEKDPDIIGLSCLLTTAWDAVKDTIEKLEESDLRNGSKIILGGAMVNDEISTEVNADAWTNSAGEGVKICKKLARGD